MEQHVYLRLQNGEIVTLDDGGVEGTSYIVQDDSNQSTSYLVPSDGVPNTSYVVEKRAGTNISVPGQAGNAIASGYGEAAVMEDVSVENDGAENIVYIVQQEGGSTDNTQYAVVEDGGSTFAIQAVNSSNDEAGKQIHVVDVLDEKLTFNRELTQVQDMSGIETLSRVATEGFTGSITQKNTEKAQPEFGKETELGMQKSENDSENKSINEYVKICFFCQQCGEAFEDLATFREHLKSEHEMGEGSDGDNELTIYPSCKVCSQTFVSVQELEAHKKVNCGEFVSETRESKDNKACSEVERESFKCKVCAACFDERSKLVKHVRTEHAKGEVGESSSSSFTKCPYCHKMYVHRGSNKAIIKHIYTVHPGKSVEALFGPGEKEEQLEEKINCLACGLGFYWHKSLIRHMKERHPELLEEKGDQIFAELGIPDSQMPTVRHRRSIKDGSNDIDLLNCPLCPKKFLWEKSLKRHMLFYHDQGEKPGRRGKKMPVVYCCPHCSLVSKYACAVRKHMERKHPKMIKDVDITTVQLPTMEAEAAMDIEFKTIDKRPAEVRLNFCPVIFRCPFCTYASKQGSNLIRHLTSVKHGNIFSHEELKELGIASFKVKQNVTKDNDTEKLDGTSYKNLPKLRMKGKLLDIVMKKYEILKNRKQRNKENGIEAVENEEDFGDMDIDNIIDLAEDESEESFDEEENDDDIEMKNKKEVGCRRGLREKREGVSTRHIMQTRTVREKREGVSTRHVMQSRAGKKDKLQTLEDTQSSTVAVNIGEMDEAIKNENADNDDEEQDEIVSGGKSVGHASEMEQPEILNVDNEIIESDDEEVDFDIGSPSEEKSTDDKKQLVAAKKDVELGQVKTPRKSKEIKVVTQSLPKTSGISIQRIESTDKRTSATVLTDINKTSPRTRRKTTSRGIQGLGKGSLMKSDSHICKLCKKEFTDFGTFKQHLFAHINMKVFFRCVECDSEFSLLKDLKDHLLKEHGQSFSESSLLCLHTDVIKMDSKPVTTYDCPYCEMLFSQAGTLQQHVIMDHKHSIQSSSIKQESTHTSKYNFPETVVSAFNCKFCECFYHNIKDIVKHMYVIHKDIDKSASVGNDLSVRKSARKRRLPKWLEEASDESSRTKRQKQGRIFDSEKQTDERDQPKPSGSTRVSVRNRSMEMTVSDNVKVKEIGSSKKSTPEVNTNEVFTPDIKEASPSHPGSRKKAENAKRKAVDIENKKNVENSSADKQDETESQNKCPYCGFIARRSSALTFHINFKHANVKDMQSSRQETGKPMPSMTPKKFKPADFPKTQNMSKGDKSEDASLLNKGLVITKAEDHIQGKDSSLQNENKGIARLMKKKTFEELEETENDMETEDEFDDYDIEYGDSDDDYSPEKDEDSSSNAEESDNDAGKGNISMKFHCPYCETGTFTSFTLLETHVKEKHPKLVDSFSIADVKTEVALDETVRSSDLVHSCKYCHKKFLSKSHVRAHIRNRHRKRLDGESRSMEGLKKSEMELYKCQFCNVVADTKNEVLAHISRQHSLEKDINLDEIEKYVPPDAYSLQNLYKCPHCEMRSKWKQAILRHISHSHSEVEKGTSEIIRQKEIVKNQEQNKYQCVYCNWQYDKKSDVLTHMTEAHPNEPSVTEDDIFEVEISDNVEDHFQCPYCDLQSKYKRCIVRHVGRAHKDRKGFTKSDVICLSSKKSRNSVGEGLVYMCPFCDFDSRWRQCVIRHVNQSHPDVLDFNSETVPSEYRKKSLLNLDEIHPVGTEENDVEYFKCSFCDAVFETKKDAVFHISNSHPKKSCSISIQVEKAVWNDAIAYEEDVVYRCPVCDSGSKKKKTVVLHVKKDHPEVKKFYVELCKAELTKGEGEASTKYKCKLCNEVLSSTRAVEGHALQVHGKEDLIVVDKIQAGQKLANVFKCMYCDHSSAWRNAIMKHVEIHHPVVEDFQAKDVICEVVQEGELEGTGGYQCPYCNTVNHWKKSIIRHMRTVHPYESHDIEIRYNPAVSVRLGGKSSRKSSKQIDCLRCGTSCRSMEKMRKHFLAKHPKLAKNFLSKENTEFSYESFSGRSLDHVCVLCNAKYMWKKSLLVHVKNQHSDMFEVYQALDHLVDIVACAGGQENNTDQMSVATRPGAVEETATAKPEKQGRCGKCRLVFKTLWAANVHKRLKHRKVPQHRIQCSKCSLTFLKQSSYLQHKIRYHRNRKSTTVLSCNVSACQFRCKFRKILQNHYRNVHNINIPVPRSKTFTTFSLTASSSGKCEICSKSFGNALQLKHHVAMHRKQRRVRFQCGYCGEQFLTRTLRDSHMETSHMDKAEMCDICGALYAKNNLKKHMRTHEEENVEEIECPHCQKSIAAKTLNRHVLQEHQDILNCECEVCRSGEELAKDGRYRCSLCRRSFCDKTMLFVHSKLHHTDTQRSKLFYCEACPDRYFLSKRMKDEHCREHHKKRSAQKPLVSVSRSTSTYSDTVPTTHVIHIGQDEGRQYLPKLSESSMNAVIKELVVIEKGVENPYKCLLCGRCFSKSKYIKLHIRRAHVRDEDQPYRCKVCGSGFVRLTEFRKHSRSHSDFRPYKCRYCDKAFKQQANLRDHYRVHTNTKEYECYICKTKFKQRGGLTSHVVFHDTLKPFKCMYCQKGFTTRGEVSRHMQKYNTDPDRTHPCHICEESFPHYPTLLKHIEAHNPEKPFHCEACKEKFSNYVALYFHKVKEQHFLSGEIQEKLKDFQKKGRKFRAKKRTLEISGPDIVYSTSQPVTETIYISQPDSYAETEGGIKPVEVIIEGIGQDQVVRVQENEPEHEELLSIAKQLTELSGFQGSEYYTNKKNIHQEEDAIIKDMLDADEDVLANLSKPSARDKTYDDERDNTSNTENMEHQDVNTDSVEESYDYMPQTENAESAATSEQYSFVDETGGQVKFPGRQVPTNMEELVSLVSQNSSDGNNEQVLAYQNEDGSVIYVCLGEDQIIKTEEVLAEEAPMETDIAEGASETVVHETEEADFNIECNETAEELYEETSETVTGESQGVETANATSCEEQPMETGSADVVQIPGTHQTETYREIQRDEITDIQKQEIEAGEKVLGHIITQTTEIRPLETNEIQMAQFVTTEEDIPVSGEQQNLPANHLVNTVVDEVQNQDYSIVEPKYDDSIITIKPQSTVNGEVPESHEDLIRRSQLARHLTGNIQPSEETARIHTHLIVTEGGLQNISNFEPQVSQDGAQGENVCQSTITIAATGSGQSDVVGVQDAMNSNPSFEQMAVARQGESFVEGEETLVEYQIDESRFIKEELLDTEYSGMSEKDREVMFFSDNIYTYSQLEKKFICLHCGAKIGTFKNLKNHIRRHAPLSSRTHVCSYCAKRFVTKNELKRHIYTHTGERNYECRHCGKKFIQPGHLQEHERLHTGKKPFQCTHCSASFITKSQLVLHFSRLHSNNEIPCNMCDKVFKNDIDLRRHKGLEHSGIKVQTPVVKEVGDHICDICGQSFNKKASLKRHLEKHNWESLDESEKVQELFACEECGISFKTKYYVKEHYKLTHSQESSEVCKLCGMRFKTKNMLRRHNVRKHTEDGNRKWHCNICNKELGSKYAYGYHMGSKHPNVCADN